ncbi:DUF2884 family protein [Rheinheimera sp.]|uniref:DUF2884 family protein n=1 Tax=Rheinheimera sp. TaxID=1869214 RepID=UPI0027BAC65F|nr:DUF2884 family protein [Rheinheimera sp.]
MQLVLLFVLLFYATVSSANECQMAFRHGILISPEQIRVLTDDRTQFQINDDKQLFIQGQWISLSTQDTLLLEQYSQGMRKFVPQVVAIAVDSVELGLSAIEGMLIGVGNESQQEEWQALVRETTYQLMSRFVRSGEHFYLAPQSLNEMDAFLHGELKENLTSLAKNTVGAVWGALRDALRQTDDNFERSESQDWQSVEQLISKINLGLDAKAEELEDKSALFCQRLRELDDIETQLQQQVPKLRDYDVVIAK